MRLVISLFCLALTASQLLAESVSELLHFDHQGTQRSYFIHLPAAHDGPMPLFVLLHGMGGSAEKLRYGLGFNERANQQGFAVLYPQGQRLLMAAAIGMRGCRLQRLMIPDFCQT